ncbi:hypothetical protein XELAEV_18040913mg [Xenopus laevis]|uniref:Uncharacterized protein n=1 Tax=Xenopus laevis TaxID=8355 RepID=A0A974H9S7_XENLA|nr:hypothetical protein XELAEV_18040913mg [Xenopus laevis]
MDTGAGGLLPWFSNTPVSCSSPQCALLMEKVPRTNPRTDWGHRCVGSRSNPTNWEPVELTHWCRWVRWNDAGF